ncbi:MAG: DUF2442 domain-containing protein [Actinomycetota bacterium]|nr:DUF2442 domain-containing protein [Actinomycetota bacterium]
MKPNYRIPHVEKVEVPRAHVIRLTFDDGLVRELELVPGSNSGTVFAPLADPEYFARVRVDPESRTVSWPNGLDLDPAVLHGDFEPAGVNHFRVVPSPSTRTATG